MEAVLNLFSSNPVAMILFFIAAIGWIFVRPEWGFTTRSKLKDLEPVRQDAKRIAKTPDTVGEIQNEMGKISTELDNLSTTMNAFLIGMMISQSKPSVKHDGPISLNEYGIALSQKMDASSIADQYIQKLIDEAKEQHMNAYQIQQSCFNFSANEILENLEKDDKEQFDRLANLAYDEGIIIEALMQIVGFVLRDQVLQAIGKSHKEIDEKADQPQLI